MKEISVKKNFIYNVLYQIFIIIVPFITTPYISRVLGVNGIGNYSYTASITSYFSLFASFGSTMYGQRKIAYCRENKIQRSEVFYNVETFKLFTTGLSSSLYILFCIFIADNNFVTLLFIQEINIVAVFFDISWYFQGLENFKITIGRNFIVKIISVAAIFAFVNSKNDLNIYVLIICLSTLIGNIYLWAYMPKDVLPITKIKLSPFSDFKTITELFVPMIAVQVYNVLDKTMIGVITKSSAENGYYEQTTRIVSICLTIVTSLGPVLLPHMSNAYARNDTNEIRELSTKAFKIETLMSCPICFGLIGISDSFVPWFFGSGYDKVSLLLKIYSLVIIIIPLSNVAGYAILTPTGNQNKGTLAVIVGAAANVACNYFMIRSWKSIGAAIATIIAESLVSAIHLYFVKQYLDLRQVFKYLLKNSIAAIFMMFIVIIIDKVLFSLSFAGIAITFIQILAGGILYFVIIRFVYKDSFVSEIFTKSSFIYKNKKG